jgi:hypothetical protein
MTIPARNVELEGLKLEVRYTDDRPAVIRRIWASALTPRERSEVLNTWEARHGFKAPYTGPERRKRPGTMSR